MTTIETLIGDLLLRYNCVIVPHFGGFVAKQISAKVDFNAGKMMPPRKSLLFNKQLINNDGLLINELAQANGFSFDFASNEVKEKVAIWNSTLKSGNRIELDRVGFLFLDDEKNLCFEQDRFFNLLLESFGLGQVHFLTEEDVKIVEQKTVEIKPIEQKEEKIFIEAKETFKVRTLPTEVIQTSTKVAAIVEHPELKKQRSSAWKYVAAACFLPIAFYSIWIPVKTDVLESGVISLQDFNPFKQKIQETYIAPTLISTDKIKEATTEKLSDKVEELSVDIDVYTYKFDEDFFVPVKVKSKSQAPEKTQASNTSNEVISIEAVHLIVGCFSDKGNAENLVEKLKSQGLMAKIVDVQNGLHRVSAGGAISVEGLNDIKMKATNLGLSGWILK